MLKKTSINLSITLIHDYNTVCNQWLKYYYYYHHHYYYYYYGYGPIFGHYF